MGNRGAGNRLPFHNSEVQEVLSKIADVLRGTAFEGCTFLVGGAVRDELLDRGPRNDLDIVSEQDVLAATEMLWKAGVSQIPPASYPRFGTSMIRVDGHTVEFVTARKESYSEDSRKPSVKRATLLDDAKRRDFTVNTLTIDIFSGELGDPLGMGLADLRDKVVRTPLDPVATLHDDPLRILRAVRFRWQLGFSYDPELKSALKSQAARLKVISAERIRDEFVKMLSLPDAANCLRDMMELGILDQFIPEFRATVGCEQGDYHHLDVWNHTLLALHNAHSKDIVLSLGVLLHDIGKPPTQSIDETGAHRFFEHERVGEEMASKIVRRLRFGGDTEIRVARLVRNHMRLNSMDHLTEKAARRIIRDLGEDLDLWLNLVEADASALKKGVRILDMDSVRRTLAEVQVETPAEALVSPLSGGEIMEILGCEPGPNIGSLKDALTEDVIEGRVAVGDKVEAKARLLFHARNGSPS